MVYAQPSPTRVATGEATVRVYLMVEAVVPVSFGFVPGVGDFYQYAADAASEYLKNELTAWAESLPGVDAGVTVEDTEVLS